MELQPKRYKVLLMFYILNDIYKTSIFFCIFIHYFTGEEKMKTELKLTLNNLKSNIKRTLFTIISIMLCSILIFTTTILVSSIKNGIIEISEKEKNDYHIILKDLNNKDFEKIKNKEYIEKIYIQKTNDTELTEVDKNYAMKDNEKNLNIYVRYKNVKDVCKYSNDILQTLNISTDEIENSKNKCEFNQKLLTIYGIIDVEIETENYIPKCIARINYSYAIELMIIIIFAAISILFIIILYNAFLITINERKKEYAVLSSIGETEGQILKMILFEGIIMGTIGILIGGIISIFSSNVILELLNNILKNTGYNFRFILNIRYIILSLGIIIFNIFISSIIPSIKASTTSVIQGIRNNKQIKHRKNTVIERILPIEGRVAIKNVKRNKNKYSIIIMLLVICMLSYITINTYIQYEKESVKLINKYDSDAKLSIDLTQNINYKKILKDYENNTGDKIEYTEYKLTGINVLVEPKQALLTDNVTTYNDGKQSMHMVIVGLDGETYNNYIKKLNAQYGDYIIYNKATEILEGRDLVYTNYDVLKTGINFDLNLISVLNDEENEVNQYKKINNGKLNGNYIITNENIKGFKELQFKYLAPIIFTNMENYNNIQKINSDYNDTEEYEVENWIVSDLDEILIKVKCKNIMNFSSYIDNIVKKQNIGIDAEYYSLENQEKIIYIEIVQLILNIIVISIIIIGIISTINIINASICERKQEFIVLNIVGATEENINKILMFECIYMFLKALMITIVLSIPIIYMIIKYMQNIIIENKLLVPFGKINLFIMGLFIISLMIFKYATNFIKKWQNYRREQ